jgi:hypothetical protein
MRERIACDDAVWRQTAQHQSVKLNRTKKENMTSITHPIVNHTHRT